MRIWMLLVESCKHELMQSCNRVIYIIVSCFFIACFCHEVIYRRHFVSNSQKMMLLSIIPPNRQVNLYLSPYLLTGSVCYYTRQATGRSHFKAVLQYFSLLSKLKYPIAYVADRVVPVIAGGMNNE